MRGADQRGEGEHFEHSELFIPNFPIPWVDGFQRFQKSVFNVFSVLLLQVRGPFDLEHMVNTRTVRPHPLSS
jgi:hypothetical protein